MSFNNTFYIFKERIRKVLEIGTNEEQFILARQRTIYFNSILIALPLVYFIFVLINYKTYLRPINEWLFDQYGFFIFVFVCLFSYFLNYLSIIKISKVVFIVSWPVIMHIVPIMLLQTPTDYYIAFPMGLIFHSILIQIIFSNKNEPLFYWTALILNFILTANFLSFLQFYDLDAEEGLKHLIGHELYVLVVILYWLLFNLIIFYLLRINDSNLHKVSDSKDVIELQNADLEDALDKLKKSNEQLIRSEKLASLGTFTAGISHELNNPINYISSGTNYLFGVLDDIKQEKAFDEKLFGKYFAEIDKIKEAIETGLVKTENIISSLRNYAHTGNDNYVQANSINSIKDALLLLRSTYSNKIRITEEFPDELMIYCNPSKLNQVFFNLIHNAIQAVDKNGEITIRAFYNNWNEAVFIVEDNGEGISKENQLKIFDPFFTTKEVGKGTGLGLYIVHSIVEEHKGRISIKSSPNEGSVFEVRIPVINNQEEA